MAILRSLDGKFFDVPDDQLEKYALPAEKVQQLGGPMEGPMGHGPELPGHITINLNFGAPPQMGRPAGGAPQEDVQGHGSGGYYVNYYYNTYSASYRNR
ncbi:MAG: hypothetical protein IT371_00180 [Deltaproteobacteria bacterium]|nr:hypothetical protein [Deltaproteobacteria bacterium]